MDKDRLNYYENLFKEFVMSSVIDESAFYRWKKSWLDEALEKAKSIIWISFDLRFIIIFFCLFS